MRDIFKKLITVIMITALSSSLCAVSALAEIPSKSRADLSALENTELITLGDDIELNEDDNAEEIIHNAIYDAIQDYRLAELTDINGTEKYAVTADIETAELNISKIDALQGIIQTLIFDEPLFFYTDFTSVGFRYNTSTDCFTDVTIAFQYGPAEIEKRLEEFKTKANAITANIEKEAVTDFDKALLAYDYLAKTCEYDTPSSLITTSVGHGADDAILKGLAVCQGYSSAYKYLLDKMGIRCENAYDNADHHQWSMVEIDGSWYHADITFADPTPDKLGYISHNYFLLTDDEIAEVPNHSQWDKSETLICGNDKYSDLPVWRDITNPIVYNGEYIYFAKSYFDDDGGLYTVIYRTDRNFENAEAYFSLVNNNQANTDISASEIWRYKGFYSGLDVIDNYLYFNTKTKIWRIDLAADTPTPECVLTVDGMGDEGIGGSYTDGNKFYYAAMTTIEVPLGIIIGTDNQNKKRYTISYDYKLNSITDNENSVTVNMNSIGNAFGGSALAAVYDKDGVLLDIDFKAIHNTDLAEDGNITFDVSTAGAKTVSAFVWNNFYNLEPLSGKLSVEK